jgi:hypothetical protein
VQNGFFTVDYQRVSRIVSALKTHHGFGLIRQQINNFPFALISPLGTDYDYVFSHCQVSWLYEPASMCR